MALSVRSAITNFSERLWLPPSAFAGLLVVLIARSKRTEIQTSIFQTGREPQVGQTIFPAEERTENGKLAKGRTMLLAFARTCSSCTLNKLDSGMLHASASLKIEVYRNGRSRWSSEPPSAGFDKRLNLSDSDFNKLNAIWYPRLYRLSPRGTLADIQKFGADPNAFIRESE